MQLRKVIGSGVVRAIGAFLAILVPFVIAQEQGVEFVGEYVRITAVLILASLVSRLGQDFLIVKELGGRWFSEDVRVVIAKLGKLYVILAIFSICISFFLMEIGAFRFKGDEAFRQLVLFSVFFHMSIFFVGSIFRAASLPTVAAFIETCLLPLCFGASFFFLKSLSAAQVYYYSLPAACCISLFFLVLVYRSGSSNDGPSDDFSSLSLRSLINSGSNILVSQFSNMGMNMGGAIILSLYVSDMDVGEFGIAQRVSTLIGFLLVIVNSVYVSNYAVLVRRGELNVLRETAGYVGSYLTGIALFLSVLIFIGGGHVMDLFDVDGDSMTGVICLRLLLIGQLVNVWVGSAGPILNLLGGQATLRNITSIWLVIFCISGVVLVPLFGAIAMACVMALCQIFVNLNVLYCLYVRTGKIFLPNFGLKVGERM